MTTHDGEEPPIAESVDSGNKRKTRDSGAALPPKGPKAKRVYTKRARCWEHFVQIEDDHEGWKQFCFDVLPLYKTFSRRTCTRDIVALYMKEKGVLKELFVVDKKNKSPHIYGSPIQPCTTTWSSQLTGLM